MKMFKLNLFLKENFTVVANINTNNFIIHFLNFKF